MELGKRNTAGLMLLLAATAIGAVPAFGHDCAADKDPRREQLSIGYSLLHQEAKGLPKLQWLLAFKSKSPEMSRLTTDLMHYYEDLNSSLEKLSHDFPAVCLEATTMPEIIGETREAMGRDQAKDMAPLVGKGGKSFERETLLMFADALNEQRHLVAIMKDKESVAALRTFLITTQEQLDRHYDQVRSLLRTAYFSH